MARYVIRVNFPNGAVAWLRHGPVVGTGPIVRFPNKKTADVNLDMIREGLDDGAIASVVRIAPSVPKKRRKSAPSRNAEAKAVAEPVSVGAHESSSSTTPGGGQ